MSYTHRLVPMTCILRPAEERDCGYLGKLESAFEVPTEPSTKSISPASIMVSQAMGKLWTIQLIWMMLLAVCRHSDAQKKILRCVQQVKGGFSFSHVVVEVLA